MKIISYSGEQFLFYPFGIKHKKSVDQRSLERIQYTDIYQDGICGKPVPVMLLLYYITT